MFTTHYPPLVAGYLVALAGWLAAQRLFPTLWPAEPVPELARPWRELGIALLGAVAVLAVGQLWIRGIRLPEEGAAGPLLAALNQLFIFAPILLVPVLRRQPWTTAWLPLPRLPQRLLVGVGLASLAVTAYALLRAGADPPWAVAARIGRYDHLDEMVQVLLEDLTIAILFVRLAAAIGRRWATVGVAVLFAAGHVPALLSAGAAPAELARLVLDAGLGVAVILVLQRSRDVVWFWCVHFCLDMTQYARVSGV